MENNENPLWCKLLLALIGPAILLAFAAIILFATPAKSSPQADAGHLWQPVKISDPPPSDTITYNSVGRVVRYDRVANTTKMATFTADATAYTASPDETDSDACHTADGSDVCTWRLDERGRLTNMAARVNRNEVDVSGVCAVNGPPFGTILWSEPTGFCVVLDRMNGRYANWGRVDLLLPTKADAKEFGLKKKILFTIVSLGKRAQ